MVMKKSCIYSKVYFLQYTLQFGIRLHTDNRSFNGCKYNVYILSSACVIFFCIYLNKPFLQVFQYFALFKGPLFLLKVIKILKYVPPLVLGRGHTFLNEVLVFLIGI